MDVFMVALEGGVGIDTVAAETPEKMIKVWVEPLLGMKAFEWRERACGLGVTGDAFQAAMRVFMQMCRA